MSLVSDLINVLTYEEVKVLGNLNTNRQETALLHLLISHRHKPEPTNECLTQKLLTTSANCDKLKAILLRKVYHELVPDGGLKLLEFLARKKLVNHLFYRELLRAEKEAEKTLSKDELKTFYKQVFFLLTGVTYQDYNAKAARKFADKTIALSSNADDKVFVEAKLLWTEVNGAGISASIGKPAVRKHLVEKIKAFEAFALGVNSPEAHYQINYLWLWFCVLTDAYADALMRCENNIHLLRSHNGIFPANYHLNTEFKYAEMLYFNNRFEEAFRQYKALFYEKYPERLNSEIYHIAKFVQVCVVVEKFDDALHALVHYSSQAKPAMNASNVIAILHFAKVYLAMGELEQGFNHVLKARSIINKNVYVQYEIELRNLENAYFYLHGDRKFAVALARKNLKFLNSRQLTSNITDYSYFYHLIIAFFNLQEKGKSLTAEQIKMLDRYSQASYAQYGYLLKKMLDNCK